MSVRHTIPVDYPPVVRPPPEEYYGRRQVLYEPEYVPPPRERVRTFRELPPHRMPDYYNNKYEDEAASSAAAKVGQYFCILAKVLILTAIT